MENLGEKDGIDAMAVSEKADDTRGDKANTSSGDEETNQTTENTKRKGREESSSEPPTDGEDDAPVQKKKRVMWTSEMHQKFVDAIAQIGHDRAFPKKIVEVMNEPGLTRENVASHLQKYRICLKKSHQEGMNKYGSQENFQQPYLWSSQLASSGNYLSMASSSNSANYGIRTSIGASRVRLAPPSYSSFDLSSLHINKENVQNQDDRRTEVNRSFRAYTDEDQRNMLSSILNKNPSNTLPDDHARITSTNNSAFPGLRIGSDGKSLLFGGSDRSAIVSSESYSTKRNEFYGQGSSSPLIPSFNVENYFQGPPLPQMPDSNTINNLEEPSLPPLPGFSVESSLPQLETDENDPFTFIPQQGSSYGTNLQTEDINSFSSGYTGTSLEQQNYLETLPWETLLESAEMDMISQTSHATNEAFNHMTASSTTLTPPWYPNSYTASYPLNTNLINQEPSLPPLPSDTPLGFYPDSTILNPIPQVMNEESLLPSIPLESQWNVNSDASTMGGSTSILEQQSPQLPSLPSEIDPWNLDSDLVPEAYNGNFFDEPNIMSPSLSETLEDVMQQLSSDDFDLW